MNYQNEAKQVRSQPQPQHQPQQPASRQPMTPLSKSLIDKVRAQVKSHNH